MLGSVKVSYFLVKNKISYPKARLIRFSIDIRNKKNIDYGHNLATRVGCRLECFPKLPTNEKLLKFGDNVHMSASESFVIGNNLLMASKIYISDCSHGSYSGNVEDSSPNSLPSSRPLTMEPVEIEDNVWLGEFVSLLLVGVLL